MQLAKIEGTVLEEPMVFENICKFIVQTKIGNYQVISEDIQAIKDNVFITKGQDVIIDGVEIINEKLLKVLFSKKSKIILQK